MPSWHTGETWLEKGDTSDKPKYNSQELDKETGFYFYNTRHYDPELSRFVTPDTVIDGEYSKQGWNRYMYCHGNPVKYKDPSGHWKDESRVSVYQQGCFMNAVKVNEGTVTKGDSLWSIAKNQLSKEKGTSKVTDNEIARKVESIKDINGLQDDKLKPGQKLSLGNGKQSFKGLTNRMSGAA